MDLFRCLAFRFFSFAELLSFRAVNSVYSLNNRNNQISNNSNKKCLSKLIGIEEAPTIKVLTRSFLTNAYVLWFDSQMKKIQPLTVTLGLFLVALS